MSKTLAYRQSSLARKSTYVDSMEGHVDSKFPNESEVQGGPYCDSIGMDVLGRVRNSFIHHMDRSPFLESCFEMKYI